MSTGMAQRRRASRMGWLIRVSVAALLALALSPVHGQHPAAATTDKVLILGGTVTGGASSIEATEAAADGFGVDIVDTATWSSMTATQFASYRAIILGDPTCYAPGTSPDIDAAAADSSVWGPVINGNVVVLGTDPVYHAAAGGATVTQRGIDFAVAQSGKTGAYISLSCYYHDTAPNTPVPLLNGIGSGGFTVTGVGCYNNAHIVALSPALTGLTDADLSNWSCSVHEAFQTWSPGLVPLAIARDFSSSYTASDGTQGPPYILAGGDIRSFPLSLSPLSDSAAAGGTHTVTAQLLDGSTAAPVTGALIGFRVISGPNTGVSGNCTPTTCLTNTAGQVTWTYLSNGQFGADTIEAFLDTNSNGLPDAGEPQTTAGVTWTIPPKMVLGLGDSIAAGHGNGADDNFHAYPHVLGSMLGWGHQDYAISGACAATLGYDGASSMTPGGSTYCTKSVLHDEVPNIPNNLSSGSVITLNVGADDIEFSACFAAVVQGRAGTSSDPCSGQQFQDHLTALNFNLNLVIQRLHSIEPGVKIVLVSQYNPMPPAPGNRDTPCVLFKLAAYAKAYQDRSPSEASDATARAYQTQAANIASRVIRQLNSQLSSVALQDGVPLVNLDFFGHDLCEPYSGPSETSSWIYAPAGSARYGAVSFNLTPSYTCISPCPETDPSFSGSGTKFGLSWHYYLSVNGAPHPNVRGQRAIATAIKGQMHL